MKTSDGGPSVSMSHTPGPWEVCGCVGRGLLLRFEIRREGEGITGGIHAEVKALNATAVAYDTAEANARLIAAAPDLLEALKAAKSFIHSVRPGGGVLRGESDLLLAIDAAIAKAEGGAA